MKQIKKHRDMATKSNVRLRRARRLYVFLCRHALATGEINEAMVRMTRKMYDRQLYAWTKEICWREYRFRILRYLWRGDTGAGEWGFWLRRRGFDQNFHHVKEKAA